MNTVGNTIQSLLINTFSSDQLHRARRPLLCPFLLHFTHEKQFIPAVESSFYNGHIKGTYHIIIIGFWLVIKPTGTLKTPFMKGAMALEKNTK